MLFNFYQFLQECYFSAPGFIPGSYIAFSCHVSLVFALCSHSFLAFRGLNLLKSTGQLICRMLSVWEHLVFWLWDRGFSLMPEYTEMVYPSQDIVWVGTLCQYVLFLVILNFIILLRFYLLGFPPAMLLVSPL